MSSSQTPGGGGGTSLGQPTPQNPQGTSGNGTEPPEGTKPPEGTETTQPQRSWWQRYGRYVAYAILVIVGVVAIILGIRHCASCIFSDKPGTPAPAPQKNVAKVLPEEITCKDSKLVDDKDPKNLVYTAMCRPAKWGYPPKRDPNTNYTEYFPTKIVCPKGHKAKPVFAKAINPEGKEVITAPKVDITGCTWKMASK